MKSWAMVAGMSVLAAMLSQPIHAGAQPDGDAAEQKFGMAPIGTVRKADGHASLVIKPAYRPGLLGLDGFSHVWVLWWFDRNDTPAKRSILQVHPRGNPANPRTGVFATRAPVRPNLIAMTLCRVVSVTNGVVEVDAMDAFDGTPILDLKPYTIGNDAPEGPLSFPDWL